MRLGLIAVAALLGTAAVSLTLVAGGTAAGRHAARASTLGTATGLLNLAFADARAKGSFHQSVTQVSGGVQGSLTDDVTLTSGRQLIVSSDGTRAEVEVIGHTAYMTGNQYALKSFFKFTRNEISVIGSNWVSIPSTNTAFSSIAYDVTVPTALAEVAPSGHLTEGRKLTLNGQQAIAISGGIPAAFAGGTDGHATIYLTATSDPLPIKATLQLTQSNHKKLELTAIMGDWGEHVAVKPPSGQELSDAQIKVLVGELSALAIPGHPGYFALEGQHRHATPVGRPWGRPCKPVRLRVDGNVPSWIYTQIATVVGQARKQGVDVTVESRRFAWRQRSLYYRSGQSPATTAQVKISATGLTPSTTNAKLPLQLTSSSRLDGDQHNEDLTSVAGSFSLPRLDGKPQTVRRSIRQLIAWTQGIFETTDPVSGITQRSFTDRFTKSDVAAMLAMSGCVKPAGNTVTGIAA
ncbi:MAG TPA: hypothetical protein VG293_05045 [Solirubrobacteraceae bacterium]|nr:hypothetical protein [Solirubrobacteraceae bacterium]